jgi:3',5'-cyclic AMP phosphodiesterase CpdA
MVDDINDLQQVDAVFLVGDLTDFGLIREFGWLNESLLRLECPFIAVIGNHDCLANGTELFERTYGPLDQHFDWAGIRFVLHNTNSREFSFNGQVPDINWMRSAVEDTSAYRASIFVSHIKPFDEIDCAAPAHHYSVYMDMIIFPILLRHMAVTCIFMLPDHRPIAAMPL